MLLCTAVCCWQLDADSRAHYHLAHVLEKLNKPEEAMTQLEQAIKLNPELAGAYFLQGRLQKDPQQTVAYAVEPNHA